MAINVQTHVWSLDLPAHLKYVAIALADHARPDGSNARPSQAALAKKTGLTDRSIRRALHELCERGVIVKVIQGGNGSATNYTFLGVPQDANTGRPRPNRSDQYRTPTSGRSGRPRPVDQDTSVLLTIKNHKEPSGTTQGLSPSGEEPTVVSREDRMAQLKQARAALEGLTKSVE